MNGNDLNTLLEMLEEISYLEPNQWKSRAYKNAVSILKHKGEESFNRRTHWNDIPGIGSGIDSKIRQFKSEGSITKLNELRLAYPKKLNPKYYKVRKGYVTKRISRSEASELFNKLVNVLNIPIEDITLCGSYRREAELIGDLDICVSTEDKYLLSKLRKRLESEGWKVTVGGNKKLSFIIQESTMTPVDIYVTNPSEYWYNILYLTGSGNFNVRMRSKAKKLGFTLNQYSLFKGKESYPVNSEKEIFELLGMKYVYPKDRNI